MQFTLLNAEFLSGCLPAKIEDRDGETGSLKAFISLHRFSLRDLLLDAGAILFRGFEIQNASDFEAFVKHFSGKELFNYAGGTSPRTARDIAGIYTSTEYPPEIKIPLHNELSYSSIYPVHVYFCCLRPADYGGETTLGDSRAILRNLDQNTVEMFKSRKVRYVRNLGSDKGSGYSWQDAFEADDAPTVEKICDARGAEYEWTADGLRISEVRPATAVHPVTGEEVWFNQAEGFHESNVFVDGDRPFGNHLPRLHSTFGDGSPICRLTLEHVRTVIENETIKHCWKQGDVLVLDNRLAAHGRMPFQGQREVLVAMT